MDCPLSINKIVFFIVFENHLTRKKQIDKMIYTVADLGGGGGLGGLNPPPLGLPSKNLMCIEKRHHNMSRPTQYVPIALCLRLSLRQ